MFKLQDEREKNVFEFAKTFKEFWSEHSHSAVIPSYVVFGRNNICSAIILFKDNSIIENTIRILRSAAKIDSFALCIDGDITKNSVGNVLSVVDVKPNSMAMKLFNYSIEDNFDVSWTGELDIVDCSRYCRFQAILHQDLSLTDAKDDVAHIISTLGFSEDRQYFHNLRFVFSYLEKNESLYIIDLISPANPDWVDASDKLVKLLDFLERKKFISATCKKEIQNIKDCLGKAAFVRKVEEIAKENWQMCDAHKLVSPAVFAEILHHKIFDYKYDLHNFELISW
jgi:hypothetical protein